MYYGFGSRSGPSSFELRMARAAGIGGCDMQVISFMNMKGGVGKTTLAVNVAYGLAFLHKKKVLIVDGDPQFNATQYLLEDDAYLKHVKDASKGTVKDIFVPKQVGHINTALGVAKPVNKKKMSLAQCSCSIFNGGLACTRFG